MNPSARIILFSLLMTPLSSISTTGNELFGFNKNALNLWQYKIVKTHIIKEIPDDLSGITYSPISNTLFAVTNSPEKLFELDLSGHVIRSIELVNFDDTEAVTHIRNDLYAITQERRRKVTFVRLNKNTTKLNALEYASLDFKTDREDNLGLEGIAWSETTGLFIANEKNPIRVSHLPAELLTPTLHSNQRGTAKHNFDNLPLNDISGLHADPDSQHILVLSDESHRLLEIDLNGDVQSEFSFDQGIALPHYAINQPEGVTMDKHGRIYVVGEPNIMLILERG